MENSAPKFLGDSTHLRIFREAAQKNDAAIWNRWLRENNGERPNLKGADLSGLVLKGVNLDSADLTEACLAEAALTGSFDYAVLNEANLTGARMWRCRLEEQWVYQPTLLNGETAGVETEIDVNFILSP